MQIIKPYSDDIIFLDTEFSTNDLDTSQLLSIGLVKITGEELYLELKHSGKVSSWAKKHVLPYLIEEKVSEKETVKLIRKFIGKEKPYVVSFVNIYDMVYIYRLFGSISKAPFHWPPIDFASVLFGNNIDPEGYYKYKKHDFFSKIGVDIDKYTEHSAIDDVRLLRDVYLKLVSKKI